MNTQTLGIILIVGGGLIIYLNWFGSGLIQMMEFLMVEKNLKWTDQKNPFSFMNVINSNPISFSINLLGVLSLSVGVAIFIDRLILFVQTH